MRLKDHLSKNARFNYIICIYVAAMIIFTLFRIAETIIFRAQSETPVSLDGLYGKALWMGFRFDTVVSGFVLAVPLIMVAIGELTRIRKKWYYVIAHYITMVLFTVCFFACAADIPYFCYFFNRLDVVSINIIGSFSMAASMILTEPRYVVFLFVFILVAVGWWLLGRMIFRRVLLRNLDNHLPLTWGIVMTIVLLIVAFIGMRGKVRSKIPIRIGTAYFCGNPFLNQIGLNPAFTFLKSLKESGNADNAPISLTDSTTAWAVFNELREQPCDSTLAMTAPHLPEGTNVIVVLMESMSANKTGLVDPAKSLTSFLDSLMTQSLSFTQAWSSGVHTHNGIYSTLYSQPALLARHMMKCAKITQVCGLPQVLSAHGYSTTFFLTHDEDYENYRGFIHLNGFDRMVGQSSYPSSEIVGTWGVHDHVMLEHVIEHCDSIFAKRPFFVTALTCSDHGPFLVPDDIPFKPQNSDPRKRVVEYVDWAIRHFLEIASTKEWFDNTLFVFLADHGGALDNTYEMPLSYNHIPLLFYAPGRIAPQSVDRHAQQIDVAPTILAMLGIAPADHMLGIDLMCKRRPYAYFGADDKIGVVDGELFYLYRVKQNNASLYRYKEHSTEDLIDQYPDRAAAMQRHAFGMLQASQLLLDSGRTACDAR